MLDRGYIRIPRALFDSAEWKEHREFSRFEAILSLYEQASYTNGRYVNLKGYGVTLDRGQLITTIRILADLWNWSKSKVSRFLHEMRDSKWDSFRIKVETINGTSATLVTICNYDGNADELRIAGTDVGTDVGTASGTTNGTPLYIENKDIEIQIEIQYKEVNTHKLIELFTKSCACVHSEREHTYAIYRELESRGCFEKDRECYNIGLGMRLVGYVWRRFVTIQKRMAFPLTPYQANSICAVFDSDDVVRVLERMANTVGLEKKRKSVYHTLRQWLEADYEVVRKQKEKTKHIYPSK